MKKYDLIVAGGGISGVAAAVSAARDGMSVLLVEKYGSLGGAMSNSLVFPFMGFSMRKSGKLLSDGIFTEMRNRKKEYDDPSWECFKFVFDDMVTEAGVDVLFHSVIFDVKCEGREIKSVFITSKAVTYEIEADFFIDATGDGDLIALSGCEYTLGRETDNLCQPMTTCFRVDGVDVPEFCSQHNERNATWAEYRESGQAQNPRENVLYFTGLGEGIVHFNTTRVIKHNPVDPFEISKAEIIARRQVVEMMNFLKKTSKPYEKANLVSIANHIGVRESRKLKGVHVLTADEIKNCVEFPDTIALGNYEIDIHNPEGTGTYLHYFKDDEFYQIPYRSLLPKEYDNMLVAGRCLSATHEAHSAVRIMPICACMGEAAGTALAIAKKTGTNAHTVDINKVRERLLEKGAAL